jgi:hypothetical protein
MFAEKLSGETVAPSPRDNTHVRKGSASTAASPRDPRGRPDITGTLRTFTAQSSEDDANGTCSEALEELQELYSLCLLFMYFPGKSAVQTGFGIERGKPLRHIL